MSTSKTAILAIHRREYDAFNEVLDRVPEDRRHVPGVCGRWSVREVLAHMPFWNLYPLMQLEYALGGRTAEFELDEDTINEHNVDARLGFDFDMLRAEFDVTFQAVMRALEALPEEEFGPDSLLGRVLGETVDGTFADNTYAHYALHRLEIETWLDGQVT